MAQHFDPRNAPFDRLSADEAEMVRRRARHRLFPAERNHHRRDGAPDSLYIVIKGVVEERDGDDLVALRGPGDTFDTRALVQGRGSNAFVAREETLCNLLPRDVTLRLINQNPRFASFFYLDIARKLDAVSREEEAARFAPLLGARVDEMFLHPAVFVDAKDSIADAGALHAEIEALCAVRPRRRRRRHRHPLRPAQRGDPRAARPSKVRSGRLRISRSSAWPPTISSRPPCSE